MTNAVQMRFWPDADMIRDRRGQVAAFIFGQQIVSTRGRNMGWYVNGWFRDPDGRAIGWTQGASGAGPMKPMSGMTPVRPVRGLHRFDPSDR